MARQPQVTRTIPTTIATVLVADIETGVVTEREVNIPREFKKEKKLREAVENAVNNEREKLVHIKSKKIKKVLYGMSEQKFIDAAEILPERATKKTEPATEDNVG